LGVVRRGDKAPFRGFGGSGKERGASATLSMSGSATLRRRGERENGRFCIFEK